MKNTSLGTNIFQKIMVELIQILEIFASSCYLMKINKTKMCIFIFKFVVCVVKCSVFCLSMINLLYFVELDFDPIDVIIIVRGQDQGQNPWAHIQRPSIRKVEYQV